MRSRKSLRLRKKSPKRRLSKSPKRRMSKSLKRRLSKSLKRHLSKSPKRRSSKSLKKRSSKSPKKRSFKRRGKSINKKRLRGKGFLTNMANKAASLALMPVMAPVLVPLKTFQTALDKIVGDNFEKSLNELSTQLNNKLKVITYYSNKIKELQTLDLSGTKENVNSILETLKKIKNDPNYDCKEFKIGENIAKINQSLDNASNMFLKLQMDPSRNIITDMFKRLGLDVNNFDKTIYLYINNIKNLKFDELIKAQILPKQAQILSKMPSFMLTRIFNVDKGLRPIIEDLEKAVKELQNNLRTVLRGLNIQQQIQNIKNFKTIIVDCNKVKQLNPEQLTIYIGLFEMIHSLISVIDFVKSKVFDKIPLDIGQIINKIINKLKTVIEVVKTIKPNDIKNVLESIEKLIGEKFPNITNIEEVKNFIKKMIPKKSEESAAAPTAYYYM